MHLGGFTLGGKHRDETVGEIEHRVSGTAGTCCTRLPGPHPRELRTRFLVFDLGEGGLVVLPHGQRFGVLRGTEDPAIHVCLAAPIQGGRTHLRVRVRFWRSVRLALPAKPELFIRAEDLFDQYQQNEVKADQLYRGRDIEV